MNQQDIGNFQYLMEDITVLPYITFLTMLVVNEGHAFGACTFHVFRPCTGIRRLLLVLHTNRDLEAQSACQSGCICDQPTNWKTDELLLNCLQDVDITDLRGTEHEVAFVKRSFNWATVLKKIRIVFVYSMSKSSRS
uniref:Uncharacterized protein n=1 Tax=Arundo donax TaxID=35708 RepID=A0A0A9C8M6_ARUDO